ncbi:MAG TPA: hypothetical protein VK936_13825 [Longimicrobiales bacterium]|nr:hypothetical protein [Longimicrobiales bacterium]
MIEVRKAPRRSVERYALAVAVVVVMMVAVLATQASAQRSSYRECIDNSLLDYNSCLMDAATTFGKLVCDLSWELEVTYCTAKALGEIRNAFAGHE